MRCLTMFERACACSCSYVYAALLVCGFLCIWPEMELYDLECVDVCTLSFILVQLVGLSSCITSYHRKRDMHILDVCHCLHFRLFILPLLLPLPCPALPCFAINCSTFCVINLYYYYYICLVFSSFSLSLFILFL